MFDINENADFIEGSVLLLNKAKDWTSFDLVKKVRNLVIKKTGVKKLKVGHAGTLDPLATGLMIVCTGKATKRIEQFQGLDKEYIASIRLGQTTPSFDLETEIDQEFPMEHISRELIKEKLGELTGEILQMPPVYSAKRFSGKRAYDYARAGKELKMNPATVHIYELELLEFELPVIVLRIKCSKGTYVRSLASDLGKALQSGAHLAGLERTAIGEFTLSDALEIEEFEKIMKIM